MRIVGALLVGATLLAAWPATAQDADVATRVVDDMNKIFGPQNGFRANHAKGVVATGTFRATPQAAALSRAPMFDGSVVPVTVRFSDSGGFPNIPDGSPDARPHGLSVKYRLPDGSETDMVLNSLKLFPVATGQDFADLLGALIASPPDAAKPTAAERFIAAHPSVGEAFGGLGTPDSFAHEEYNGVNAFVLVGKGGQRQAVRFKVSPDEVVHIDPAEAARRPPDFLMAELPSRLKAGPVRFRLRAQLAAPGDQTRDPSKPWPADRAVAELGTLTVDVAVPDSLEAQKTLLFMPGNLPDGIEASDDPMIDIRNGAYAISFGRRQ